jgi:hypothetical protein
MNEHPIGTILEAQKACQTRVWIHSVGIINTIRDVDQARRRDWETNGTGSPLDALGYLHLFRS